ncbi:MAG: tetratricopeptide repeat protein [Crocinitomicaceae bacterium]|nr:tetratricopeptide repeat protein [Crocinitomicaceae bacterium]
MRNTTLKITSIVLTTTILSSCDVLKELEYKVTPNPLEMHGDSVRVRIDVKVPEKGIKKKVVAEITPTLGNQTLESIKVAGEKIQIGEKTIAYKAGGKVTYDKTYAYDPSFESTELLMTLKAYKGAIGTKEKKKETIDSKKLADGTIITPLLVQPDFKVVSLTQEYVQTKSFSTSFTINFDRGRSELRPNEMKDADVVAFKEWLTTNATNSKIAIKEISINGYACPDGVEGKNVTLSDSRVSTASKAIETLLKDTKYPKLDLTLLQKSKGLGEDFEGFQSKLKESKLASEDQSMIIRIIKETSDLDSREKKIKDISKVYSEIEKDIFPKLRRAEVVITYDLVGYSDEELKSISASNPSSLKLDELIQAATLTNDLKAKQTIYTTALNVNSSDKLVLNNLGVVLFEQAKYDEARTNFEKSSKIDNSSELKNNLGAVAAKKGEHDLARKLFDKNSLTEAKHNSGYYSIKRGKYADAVAQLKGYQSYNLALAQLLNGKSEDAIKTIDASSTKETADSYYLKAIANTRLNNDDAALLNLKNALAKNGGLKEKASKDKEFLRFATNSSFTSLIK